MSPAVGGNSPFACSLVCVRCSGSDNDVANRVPNLRHHSHIPDVAPAASFTSAIISHRRTSKRSPTRIPIRGMNRMEEIVRKTSYEMSTEDAVGVEVVARNEKDRSHIP